MKTALITGVTGQDGSYLCQLLLEKGYKVYGTIRRSSSWNTQRIDRLHDPDERNPYTIHTLYADMTDGSSIARAFDEAQPDEVYHLAAQSQVRVSFDQPEYTADVVAVGTTRILEEIRRNSRHVRFYNACSSEIFGNAPAPQNELTPIQPRSPYGCAKAHGYWMTKNYREGYGLFAVNGILFNHESPRRGETFITRKIAKAVARIKTAGHGIVYVGETSTSRDWGFAPEFVLAIYRMLQLNEPEDFVIGTGESHTVQEFIDAAFEYVDLDAGDHVRTDARYLRPAEVLNLCADSTKARRILDWYPTIKFYSLVKIMVDAEMEALRG